MEQSKVAQHPVHNWLVRKCGLFATTMLLRYSIPDHQQGDDFF
jgi:hypothetical protein